MPQDHNQEDAGSSRKDEIPLSEPRWPAVAAFVTTWLCPATSARRTRHLSLWSVWAVHLAAGFLTFVMITVWASIADRQFPLYYLGEIIEEFRSRWWQQAVLATIATFLGIEIAFLLFAFVLAPWGAGEERIRSSYAQSLRICWLHTSHALPTVLLVGALCILYAGEQYVYELQKPYPRFPTIRPTPPTMPADWSTNSQARRDHQAAMAEYVGEHDRMMQQNRENWDEWNRRKPLIVKYGSIVFTWIGVACSCWILWALYRAVGEGSGLPFAFRHPLCEFCGYNLSVTPMDSRCPECGELVENSLGPEVRPGTVWDRARPGERLRAWWQCGVDAIIRPSRFGRQIQARARTHRHGAFLVPHLVFTFVFAGLGTAACYLYDTLPHRSIELLLILPAIFGGMTMLTALIIAGLSAACVGMVYSFRNERNLLGASMRTACYLSFYLSLWTAFSSLLGFAGWVMADGKVFQLFARQMGMAHETLLFCLWLLVNLVLLLGYLILLWRGTAAAQYANR